MQEYYKRIVFKLGNKYITLVFLSRAGDWCYEISDTHKKNVYAFFCPGDCDIMAEVTNTWADAIHIFTEELHVGNSGLYAEIITKE